MTIDLATDEDFFLVFLFFLFFFFFLIDEDVKNVAVTSDPCYSDYESDDECEYGSSNSEVDNISESESWGFTSLSTARVIVRQVLSIVTCGGQTHTKVTACD